MRSADWPRRHRYLLYVLGVLVLLGVGWCSGVASAKEAATFDAPPAKDEQTAVLAGGCFWGVQAVFQHVRGVKSAVAGYSGGAAEQANYATVSRGNTGHAESVKIVFDPSQVSYGTLLKIFFSVAHDPTEIDRQGPDVGRQYRSAIFFRDEQQRRIAADYIAELQNRRVFASPIATRIEPFKSFYPAEDYHQDYVARHPDNPYVAINDLPKLKELSVHFPVLFHASRGE